MLTAYKDEKNSDMNVKTFARTKILIAIMRLSILINHYRAF